MGEIRAKIIGISRHRLSTDGEGVTTLVAFHGCPLHCCYCLNPLSLGDGKHIHCYLPEDLYDEISIDNLYFLATGGGVTFGGGEPCLHPQFIKRFRELCGGGWKINLETSLNIPSSNLMLLLSVVDTLFIDVKDMNPEIYSCYTGQSNSPVIENLRLIVRENRQKDCIIRLPLIPDFNTEEDRIVSRNKLESLGFDRFDLFTYKICK